MKEHLEFGKPSKYFQIGMVIAYFLMGAMTIVEMYMKNIGGVAVFAMFTGVCFGFIGCPCRVTKREYRD